ncbi:MAG: HEAT repeat domain-containing protein, partial [Myxococcota bacterium]
EVRVACAWGLGAVANPKARDHLAQAIAQDPEPSVQRMSAWGLGNLAADSKALASLLEAYWTSSPDVREVAGKALLRLGPNGQDNPPYMIWEENLGFFNQADKSFRVGFFLDTLLSDELLAQGNDGSYAILKGESALKDLLVRQIAQAQADHLSYLLYDLDQAENHISLGALTWNMPDSKERRAQMVAALDRIGEALAPKLIGLLDSRDPLVRAHAAGVLGKIGDAKAVDPLIKALSDDHKDVRRKAALALGKTGDRRATAPLLRQLGDDDWASRAHAAMALGHLRDSSAVDPLIKALDDGFPWVQASAAEALGNLGDGRAAAPLADRLDKASAPVKIEILRALAQLGGPKASEALKRYRNDPDPRIRQAVEQGGG